MDHITTGDELEEAAEIKSIYDSHMAALAALDGKKKIHLGEDDDDDDDEDEDEDDGSFEFGEETFDLIDNDSETIPFSPEQEKLLRTLIESRAADCKEYLRSRGITV